MRILEAASRTRLPRRSIIRRCPRGSCLAGHVRHHLMERKAEIRCQELKSGVSSSFLPELKSGVSSSFLPEIRCQFIILARKDELTPGYAWGQTDLEIRCQFIILARKDELTPGYPWGQTDLGYPWGQTDLEFSPQGILGVRPISVSLGSDRFRIFSTRNSKSV